MDKSSVISKFQFHSYNVYKFSFNRNTLVGFSLSKLLWSFDLGIIRPVYYSKEKVYICGISLQGVAKKENSTGEGLINFEADISGVFKVEKRIKEKGLEEKLVKIQGPSLLFPYLRSTITSYSANAGFGPIVLPLINVHQIAENSLQGIEIQELDSLKNLQAEKKS